jgi:hypothetical protein
MKQKKSANRKVLLESIPRPRQIDGVELRHSATLRFRTNQALLVNSTGVVTFQNLLDTILVETGATTALDIFEAVRVREVRVWGSNLGVTTTTALPASVSLEYGGATAGSVGNQVIHTDTSISTEPAFVRARPGPHALAADFQISSSAVAFKIGCPINSVVDVDLSFRGPTFPAGGASAQNAIVGGTAGVQALRGLDGNPVASSNYTIEFNSAGQV